MADTLYWENYYKKNKTPSDGSKFAIFVKQFFGDSIDTVLEVGCGNGRDAYHMSDKYTVIAVDNANKPVNSDSVTFKIQSMEKITDSSDLLYSRFSLHSVSESIENKVLLHALKNCKYVAIEARSTKDTLSEGKKQNRASTSYARSHFRRYIDFESFKSKLIKLGFKILHASESNTYAPYEEQKPYCVRFIAKVE